MNIVDGVDIILAGHCLIVIGARTQVGIDRMSATPVEIALDTVVVEFVVVAPMLHEIEERPLANRRPLMKRIADRAHG